MRKNVSKQKLNEMIEKSINENAAATVAVNVVVGMLSSSSGRKTLADILMILPNIIDGLCESVFPEEDQSGNLLSNIKTKLCKAVAYFMGPAALALPCKLAAELLLMLNDDTAKIVSNTIKGEPQPPSQQTMTNEPMPANFEVDNVPTGNMDIAYNPEDDLSLMEGRVFPRNYVRQLVRESVIKAKK